VTDLLALAIAAAVLIFVHIDGQRKGRSTERKHTAEVAQTLEGEIANVEYEKELARPIGDRLAALRDRILKRRSGVE